MDRTINRKNFFSKIGKGAFFTFLTASLPVKFFSHKNFVNKGVKVNTHPSAVKRIDKV